MLFLKYNNEVYDCCMRILLFIFNSDVPTFTHPWVDVSETSAACESNISNQWRWPVSPCASYVKWDWQYMESRATFSDYLCRQFIVLLFQLTWQVWESNTYREGCQVNWNNRYIVLWGDLHCQIRLLRHFSFSPVKLAIVFGNGIPLGDQLVRF